MRCWTTTCAVYWSRLGPMTIESASIRQIRELLEAELGESRAGAILYEAVRRDDMTAARAAHAVIYPLARAIYGTPPGSHATARLKTCLKILGRLKDDRVRPPIGPLPAEEVTMLRSVLGAVGLLS